MKRGRPRKYRTPEESKEVQRQMMKDWFNTREGRAYNLCKNYEQFDQKANRGQSTITPQFILDNIFTSRCVWCGETDWKLLGCDRIDNDLPHTPTNVVCSCKNCNLERNRTSFSRFQKLQGSKKCGFEQLSLF